MATRILSREERDRAIKEADSILRLGKKWQRQVPNERRPNFEAAAAAILRKALSSHVESRSRFYKAVCSTITGAARPGCSSARSR